MDEHLAKPAANHRSYSGNRASAFRLAARGAWHNRQYLFPGTQLRVPGRRGRLARLALLPRRQRRDRRSLSLSECTDPARGREPDRRSSLHAGIAGRSGLECGTGDACGLVIAVLFDAGVKFFGAASAISPAGFSLLPLIIVVVAGLWSFVAVLLMLSRVQRFGFWRTTAAYAVVLIFPLLIALAIRALLFHPYILPSGSNCLRPRSSAIAFSYRSTPTVTAVIRSPYAPPLFSGRILRAPSRSAATSLLRSPKDGMTDYVKRVVGLPGDHIQMKQGRLHQ